MKENSEKVQLKKQISLFDCVTILVGTMIGSGIFVSPVGILFYVRSIGMSYLLWALCGVYSALCAACFAELGAALPTSGGEYMYIYRAFGDFAAFLCLWTHIFNYCSGYAALCLIFSTYILQPLYKDCDEIPQVLLRLISAMVYTFIVAINCINVKWVTKLQAIITGSKLVALFGVIVIGCVWLYNGETGAFDNAFEGSDFNVGSIVFAFYSGNWAYAGWSNICMFAGEVIKPQRNIPLGIIISLCIVTVIYLVANIAYFTVLTPSEMLKSTAVAVTFAEQTIKPAAFIMPLLIGVSVLGTLNGSSLAFSRLLYVGSKMNHTPRFLSMLHVKRNTPTPSLVVICIIVLLMQNFKGIFYLIEMSGLSTSVVTSLTVAAMLYLRYKEPSLERPFKLHLSVPISIFLISLMIVLVSFYQKPKESGLAILIISVGIPLYFIGPRWKNRPPALQNKFDYMTRLLQKIMFIVPEDHED
ncbi:hypothetical protein SNE40_016071 [Patella caerulea]|uniref:Uncharacterized protein n=1 Tax=Patella caerulea TaxID=87958 RepID=A0AAN8J990_PATCE